jgi:hypothetical protein
VVCNVMYSLKSLCVCEDCICAFPNLINYHPQTLLYQQLVDITDGLITVEQLVDKKNSFPTIRCGRVWKSSFYHVLPPTVTQVRTSVRYCHRPLLSSWKSGWCVVDGENGKMIFDFYSVNCLVVNVRLPFFRVITNVCLHFFKDLPGLHLKTIVFVFSLTHTHTHTHTQIALLITHNPRSPGVSFTER